MTSAHLTTFGPGRTGEKSDALPPQYERGEGVGGGGEADSERARRRRVDHEGEARDRVRVRVVGAAPVHLRPVRIVEVETDIRAPDVIVVERHRRRVDDHLGGHPRHADVARIRHSERIALVRRGNDRRALLGGETDRQAGVRLDGVGVQIPDTPRSRRRSSRRGNPARRKAAAPLPAAGSRR